MDFFDDVVGVTRLELATTRPPDAYANQLRHTPIQSSMSFLSLLRRNAPCLSCCVMHGMRCIVGVTRLELATTRPPDAYANQLRHTPIQSSMSFLSLLRRNAPCLSCCVMHGMRCIVGVTRLELATTRPPDAYANQLRHTPIFACPEPMSLRLLS